MGRNLCDFFTNLFAYYIGYTYLCSAVAEATKNGVNDLRRYSPHNQIFKIVQM